MLSKLIFVKLFRIKIFKITLYIFRCHSCLKAGEDGDIHVAIDGGKWYALKVQKVIQESNSNATDIEIPVLPVNGWKKFPSGPIPSSFCYGIIYEHIITTARLVNQETGKADADMCTDFNTTKPMNKGRQYFISGHVTQVMDQRKENFHFFKAFVMASFTQNKQYHVSITLAIDNAKVLDASCDCKASAMGRCSHVAALLFAIEDYVLQFGYDIPSCTSQICTWNLGRKKRKNPQPAFKQQYSKKAAPDRILKHDPRPEEGKTEKEEENFINLFISTLPNCGNQTMFEKMLEIIYEDYEVDTEYLKGKVEWALEQQSGMTDQVPVEVPGTGADAELWQQARWYRVTASVAKDVAVTNSRRGVFNLLNNNLWGLDRIDTAAMKYGRKHEEDAFKLYLPPGGEKKSKTGFWINQQYVGLGCSPDGILRNNVDDIVGVIEIKCPHVLENTSPFNIENLKPNQKKNLCYTVEKGECRLKKTHKYMYQVQMQMAICDVNFCDFVIWSPQGIAIERISRDRKFWDSLYPKLEAFYKETLLPEYFEMRVPRRLLPVSLQ